MTTAHSVTTTLHRLDFIDALRGLACLSVLFYHNAGGITTDQLFRQTHHGVFSIAAMILSLGWLGVHLFLVLSGFCLFYPMIRKVPASDLSINVRTFLGRRARRILPPYYAALGLILTVAYLLHRPIILSGRLDIPMHLLMLHNLRSETLPTINPAFWSLALEWQMYLLFPLLIWVARRSLPLLIIAAATLSLGWETFVWARWGVTLPWSTAACLYHAVPGFACVFVAGMCAASLVARPRHSMLVPSLVTIGLIAPFGLYYAAKVSTVGPAVDLLWGVVFGATIVACSSVPHRLFAPNGGLSWLVRIGAFSYSIYLIHYPLLGWLDDLLLAMHWHSITSPIWIWGRLLVVVAAAYLFHRTFERPFMNSRQPKTEPLPFPAPVAPIVVPHEA